MMIGVTPSAQQPIAIIGAGPVGLLLSTLWAERGFSVRVFEKRALPYWMDPAWDTRRLILSFGSVCLLKRWGLWSALSPHAVPFRRVHVSEKGCMGRLRLSASDLDLPFLGVSLNFQALLTVLWEKAQGAGVPFETEVEIEQMRPGSPPHAPLLLRGKQDKREWPASFAVWAEGASHQEVSPNQAVEALVIRIETPANTAPFDLDQIFQRILPRNKGTHSCAALLAFVPQTTHEAVIIYSRPVSTPSSAPVFPTWQEIQQDFRGVLHIPPTGTVIQQQRFTVQEQLRSPLGQDGALRVGNAAHTLHPVAAQGFNLGLRDLADVLITWPHPSVQPDWNLYQKKRLADVQQTRQALSLLEKSAQMRGGAFVRSAVLAGLDLLPIFREVIVGRGTGLDRAAS